MENRYLTFEQWLDAVFNHPLTDPEWYFSDEADNAKLLMLESSYPSILLQYVTQTFEEIGRLPQLFSDGQIAAGLQYIIHPACSSVVYAMLDLRIDVDLAARIRCIEAIYTVYEQLFAIHCSPELATSKQNLSDRNPLNDICFMWWDIFPAPLSSEGGTPSPIDESLLNVIVKILTLDSEVCQEAALHGLNEWHFQYPQRVAALVKLFLVQHPHISSELHTYAEKVGWGAMM